MSSSFRDLRGVGTTPQMLLHCQKEQMLLTVKLRITLNNPGLIMQMQCVHSCMEYDKAVELVSKLNNFERVCTLPINSCPTTSKFFHQRASIA